MTRMQRGSWLILAVEVILSAAFAPGVRGQECEAEQTAKAGPLVGEEDDLFGYSVAISGRTFIAGQRGDNIKGLSSGSATAYRYNGSTWVGWKIVPADGAAGDVFGESVALDRDVAVIGAIGDDDLGTEAGAAYVYSYKGTGWVFEQKLHGTPPLEFEWYFGKSTAISGDVIVVGAPQDSTKGNSAGAAYVFRQSSGGRINWVLEQKLTAADGAAGDSFGYAVAVSGNVVMVGAFQDDDKGESSGSVYAYRRVGSNWVLEKKLTLANGAMNDWFGFRLALSGDAAVVTAPNRYNPEGAAYVYRYNGTTWVLEKELPAPNSGAAYGWSASIAGNAAVVGAFEDKGGTPNVRSGAAYVFRRVGTDWMEEAKLVSLDGADEDYFGAAVAVTNDFAAIGAPQHDGEAVDAGAAYVFDLVCPCPGVNLSLTCKPEKKQVTGKLSGLEAGWTITVYASCYAGARSATANNKGKAKVKFKGMAVPGCVLHVKECLDVEEMCP